MPYHISPSRGKKKIKRRAIEKEEEAVAKP
jgi:hypothetical protein